MKRLIICCDGTWNTVDQEHDGKPCPTNVVKLGYRIATSGGGVSQVIYYDQGVGTGNLVDRWTGGAFGEGLEDNIHDAYRFLVANYELGDELFLFGFSRGAFTARSLVGMIRKCGIVSRKFVERYRDALELYHSDEHPDMEAPTRFRRSHSIAGSDSIRVRFIGVWDTVGALGIPLRGLRFLTRKKYQFHDTELSGCVRTACHALAIDERRGPFAPTLWQYKPKPNQDVEQMWFCGVHSDVGGGYPETGLSDLALDWMMGKAADAGIVFDADAVQAHPAVGNPLGKLHDSMTSLYRLTKGIDRAISATDPTQSLHPSVLTRWDADPTYRPPQLRKYLRAIGDERGPRV
jgi:uncharacterized protein (DUF2235 family)